MNGWKAKLSSAVIALLGALLVMKGMTPETTWVGLVDLLGPYTVIGLVLIFWRAWVGDGQMKIPKKVTKKLP